MAGKPASTNPTHLVSVGAVRPVNLNPVRGPLKPTIKGGITRTRKAKAGKHPNRVF